MSDGSPPETTCISVTLPISKDQGTVWDESHFPVHRQPSSCSRPALLNPRTRVCIASMCFVRSNRSQANYCCFRRLCFCFLCCTLSIRIRLLLHLVDSLCLSDRCLLSLCRARGLFVFARCALSPCPGAPSSYLPTLPYEDVRIRITTDTLRALSCPKWVRSRDGSVSS